MASASPHHENISNLHVSMVTSADPRHPAENMLDGTTKSFWATTGLYPQEFIITLPTDHVIKKVTVWSMKVAGWEISRSGSEKPFDFDEVYSEDVEDTPDSTLQITTFTVSYSDTSRATAARHVKFTITRGYSDFCAVHRVAIQGEPVPERENDENNGKRKSRRDKKSSTTRKSVADDSDEEGEEDAAKASGGEDEEQENHAILRVKERD